MDFGRLAGLDWRQVWELGKREPARTRERQMKVDRINYSVSGLNCTGMLVYDETIKTPRPLLLMAPDWLGINPPAIDCARMLAGDRYIVFMADMYGEGNGPKGNENPMEFLGPLLKDARATRQRITAAFET